MRGLIKATNAANSNQARNDYSRLQRLAIEHGLQAYTPALQDGAGWKRIDAIAKHAVERIAAGYPELRTELVAIYPGFLF